MTRSWLSAVVGLVLLTSCDSPSKPALSPPTVAIASADPAPVGVAIELVAADESLPMRDDEIRVTLEPGGLSATWTPMAPAEFSGVDPSQRYRLALAGKQRSYLVEQYVKLNETAPNRIQVIPLDPLADLMGRSAPTGPLFQYFCVDTTRSRDRWATSWREGPIIIRRSTVEAVPEALARHAREQWHQYGSHRAMADPKYDHAVVVVNADSSSGQVVPIIGSVRWVERTVVDPDGDEKHQVPAFEIRVALASALAPPAPAPLPPERTASVSKAMVRPGATSVSGRLPPEEIQRVVREQTERFRLCYQHGLLKNPKLQGRVATRFVIGADGVSSLVANGGSDLPDSEVVACVIDTFRGLRYPEPEAES